MRFPKWMLAGALLLLLSAAATAADRFAEGVDYRRVDPPLPTTSGAKVEVLELFWYRCPHCDQLQPLLDDWRQRHGKEVDWQRMPAILGDTWAIQARAYYTGEALGILERVHGPLFDAYHRRRRPLKDEVDFAGFFAEYGVDNTKFKQSFHSFSVDAKVRQAVEMGRRLRLDGVPAVVVGGKYLVTPAQSGGPEKALRVMAYLVDRERSRSPR